MSITSKFRKWIFPSKDDTFDVSYDYLLDFYNQLDEEFGSVSLFLFDRKIDRFYASEAQMRMENANQNVTALIYTTREVFSYQGTQWVHDGMIGRLPILNDRNPTKTDLIGFEPGNVWVNYKTSNSFKFVGGVDNNSGSADNIEALWVDQDGKVPYQNGYLKSALFYPQGDFRYVTKRVITNQDGSVTEDDDLVHFESTIKDGVMNYMWYDTHIDIFLNEFKLGRVSLSGKQIYTFMDFEFFLPEGGLPEHGTPEIIPWNERFDKLLRYTNHSTLTDNKFCKHTKNSTVHDTSIEEIMNTNLDSFLTANSYDELSDEIMDDYRRKYRSFFTSLTDLEMSLEEKKLAIYLLEECTTMTDYDGNIYNVDGNLINADGNLRPPCV